jgi:hypothetical protein
VAEDRAGHYWTRSKFGETRLIAEKNTRFTGKWNPPPVMCRVPI